MTGNRTREEEKYTLNPLLVEEAREMVSKTAEIPTDKVVNETPVSEAEAVRIFNALAEKWFLPTLANGWRPGQPTTFGGIVDTLMRSKRREGLV
jgi:hypothetical protein